MDFLNINRPENKLKPANGRLLIAEPFLGDPNFSRSVVMLCEHSDEGTVGFVLNHMTELTLSDLLPELLIPTLTVSEGGPVQMDTLHMVHRMPEALGGNEIAPGIYWGGSYEALQAVIANDQYDPKDIRLFVGYSGWSPGQLDREVEEGSWLVANLSSDILFETDSKNTWKQALTLLGKDYAYLANMPLNPLLN